MSICSIISIKMVLREIFSLLEDKFSGYSSQMVSDIIINFSCLFLRGASGIFRVCPKVISVYANKP